MAIIIVFIFFKKSSKKQEYNSKFLFYRKNEELSWLAVIFKKLWPVGVGSGRFARIWIWQKIGPYPKH